MIGTGERVTVVEQPSYLPWLGYFDLMAQADVWVWLDDVQYTKRDWRNRNRVAAKEEAEWLTIPVRSSGRYDQEIRGVEIDYGRSWRRKHLATLDRCYGRAPHFGCVRDLIEEAFASQPTLLADLVIHLGESLAKLLGLAPEFRRSSAMALQETNRQARLIEICRESCASTYLSGPAAKAYIAPATFEERGIELRYIVYGYPEYWRGGQRFVEHLSIVDALAWIGASATATLLHGAGRWERGMDRGGAA